MSRVLIADCSLHARGHLARAFRDLGSQVWEAQDRVALRELLSTTTPDLLVSELRLADGPIVDLLESGRQQLPTLRIAVVTSYPSVATTVRCVKFGVDAYLTKPATAEQVLSALAEPATEERAIPEQPMRLERAVWEYMHRVVQNAGSISRAADLMGLDRRSLRRMLAKHAPY